MIAHALAGTWLALVPQDIERMRRAEASEIGLRAVRVEEAPSENLLGFGRLGPRPDDVTFEVTAETEFERALRATFAELHTRL
jgi:hypothetical protein